MAELLDLNLDDLIFVKSKGGKAKSYEKETYIILTKDNKKKTITLKNILIPFGIEEYQGKSIINIEINPKKNNNSYNTHCILTTFENSLKTLVEKKDITNDLRESLEGKGYYDNMRESKNGYIIRTQTYGTPSVTTNLFGEKMSASISDIKKSVSNVVLELGSLWITDTHYGISWYVKEIDIQYGK